MKRNKKGKLFIISGPSGVGKGTICQELLKDESLNLIYSISMTTRKKREKEIDGINYFFVSPEKFAKAIENNELIEYAEFVGNYYGTPKNYCEKKIGEGKNVLLEIEVQGANIVLDKLPNAISIFLTPPSLEELEKRIIKRGTEKKELIEKRLDKARMELNLKNKYKYCVENNGLEETINECKKIILEEIRK
ncbi:guanylate kinase [Spiroplasma endosymbiont of Amphibalanus improvisus]|uniref:guanylate kinase n=1 Tax=Spiroplasma endosymbiont of Amphibalanus improvisus TaxID=3066327 RepID=UPI00313ECFD4